MKSLFLSCAVLLSQFYNTEAAFFQVGDNDTTSVAARLAYDIGDRDVFWPNGTVPFKLAEGFDDGHRHLILIVLNEFKYYCVNFREMVYEDTWTKDYVKFIYNTQNPARCHADFGRKGGEQYITFSDKECFRLHSIRHQVMHTLGFWHEHQRPDRDCFIKFKPQYDTTSGTLKKNQKLSTVFPYDIHSLMHYGKYYIDNYKQLGWWDEWTFPQLVHLSALDQYVVSYIYCHKDGRPSGHVYNDDYSLVKWCEGHQKMCDDDKKFKEDCGYTGPVYLTQVIDE